MSALVDLEMVKFSPIMAAMCWNLTMTKRVMNVDSWHLSAIYSTLPIGYPFTGKLASDKLQHNSNNARS